MWTDIETAILQAALYSAKEEAIDKCIEIVRNYKWNDKKSKLLAKLENLKGE